MIDGDDMQAVRAIADMISEFRQEYLQELRDGVVKECGDVASSGYDPARGTGRGAWWAEGD